MKRLFLGVTLFVLGLGVLSAVLPQKWSLASSPDFWKGKLNGVSASGEGPLFLAARQEKKDGPSEEFYLSLAEAADGTLYLGSGHGGKVYRLAKDAPSELYFQTAEMDVTCLALDAQWPGLQDHGQGQGRDFVQPGREVHLGPPARPGRETPGRGGRERSRL
jgi:hypothetical protein